MKNLANHRCCCMCKRCKATDHRQEEKSCFHYDYVYRIIILLNVRFTVSSSKRIYVAFYFPMLLEKTTFLVSLVLTKLKKFSKAKIQVD